MTAYPEDKMTTIKSPLSNHSSLVPSIAKTVLISGMLSYNIFADFNKIAGETTNALQLANQQVVDALQALAARYEHASNKTGLSTQINTPSRGTIQSIVCGWFPNTSSHSCPDRSSSATVNHFNACLVKPYPNQLGCEIQFKDNFNEGGIPGAISGKKVLFIAKGPGLHGVDVTNTSSLWQENGQETSTPPGMDFISSYICYNPAGTTGDGINNGGPLGTFALCDNNDCSTSSASVTLYPLNLTLQPLTPFKGLQSCLTSEAQT